MKRTAEMTVPAIHDPLMVLDPEWRVLHANGPAVRTFGVMDLEGRLFWDVLPGGTGHPMAAALQRARAEGRDVVFEEHDSASGQRFEYRIYVQTGTLTILRTEAPATAAAANQMGDEFIAMVSHELRAPLNAILGWAGLLRDGSLDQQMAEHAIEVIERNARAQAEIITDLVDLSRLVAGRLPLSRHPVDLVLIVRSAIDAVRPAAAAKEITVRTDTLPDLCPLVGDADRLRQALVTLLLNAFKCTPSGGEVAVTLQTSGTDAEVCVADSGAGLPPELLQHVFNHGPQGDSVARRRNGGLGLGLVIVRHLVEAHGGRVEALSPGIGRGTTIVVRLPCGSGDTDCDTALPPLHPLG